MESKQNSDLKSVLRFAVEQIQSEDTSNLPVSTTLDTERKVFLESALLSMASDIHKELEMAIQKLENEEATLDEKRVCLSLIREHIDDLDFANSFVKAGGSKTIITYLKCEVNELRTLAIYIVSEMSQNNPFCQQHFLNEKVIPLLVSYFKYDCEDVSQSSVHAVSALVRNYEPGLIEFLRVGGVKNLITCLTSTFPRVSIKGLNLIGTLSAENSELRDEFVNQNTIPIIIHHIKHVQEFDVKVEMALRALSELTKSQQWKPKSKQEMTNINNFMSTIITKTEDLSECEEMTTYAKNIIINLRKIET